MIFNLPMMKKIIANTLMFSLLVLFFNNSNAQMAARMVQDFDNNWKFYLGNAEDAKNISFNDASWRSLNLPHDWSIELPFDSTSPTGNGGGALRGGMGWYRKTFSLPASSKDKNVKKAGTIQLTASGDGLQSSSIVITTK